MTTPTIESVTILGSGPAGLTAAVYAARANLSPLVVEGDNPGGQLTITSEVENFPGFAEPVLGPDLVSTLKKQAERFGTRFRGGAVKEVDVSKRPFSLTLTDGSLVKTETLIIATGATAKWLGLPNETRLQGRGVSACATCDGFFFKNKDVVVVGGGDSAMEEATFLTRFAKSVKLVHRRDQFRASKIMLEKARKNPKISFELDCTVDDVLGADKVAGVCLRNLKTGATRDVPADGLFLAIGHEPNTAPFRKWLACDDKGYLVTEKGSSRTAVPGVFAAGDVADSVYRQAVTAAGTGCMAALDAERFLEALHG